MANRAISLQSRPEYAGALDLAVFLVVVMCFYCARAFPGVLMFDCEHKQL